MTILSKILCHFAITISVKNLKCGFYLFSVAFHLALIHSIFYAMCCYCSTAKVLLCCYRIMNNVSSKKSLSWIHKVVLSGSELVLLSQIKSFSHMNLNWMGPIIKPSQSR